MPCGRMTIALYLTCEENMPCKVIPVPKTPTEAFNPDRRASTLLRTQALHLREALIKHVAEAAAALAIDPKTLHTEAEFSEYIREATAALNPQYAKRPR